MTAYILLLLVIAVFSYCFGSLSTTVLASNFVFRRNLKKLGEGNVGLSNFRRVYGIFGFVKLLLVELVKDGLPLLVGGLIMGAKGHSQAGIAFAGFCMVLGRLYPVFYGFKGSHATIALILAGVVVDRTAGITAILALGAALWFTRYVSLSTMISAFFLIAVSLLEVDDRTVMLLAVFMGLIVLIKHIPAIKRLRERTEIRLSFEKDISYKFDQKF